MRPSFSFSVIGRGLESLGIRRPYGALTTGRRALHCANWPTAKERLNKGLAHGEME